MHNSPFSRQHYKSQNVHCLTPLGNRPDGSFKKQLRNKVGNIDQFASQELDPNVNKQLPTDIVYNAEIY